MSSDESIRQERGDEAALIERARAIHGKILSIDSHIDFAPGDLTDARNYTERLETQFDLAKMIEGDLKALFFSIYVGQTRETQNPEAFKASGYERAHKLAVEKFEAVRHFTNGQMTLKELVEVIDRSILPEFTAAQARIKKLQRVPYAQASLLAGANEYLTLREESWRARSAGLRRKSLGTMRPPDETERASLEVLDRIRPAVPVAAQ